MDKRRQRLVLTLLLGCYLLLAVAYSLANPLYEATDEVRHVRFVRHIAVFHTLPEQSLEGPRAQSHHPPLYYLGAALASWWVPVEQDVYYEPTINPFWAYRYWEVGRDNKNQYVHSNDERFPFRGIALSVYLMRWYSVLLGAAMVWLTYWLGREVWPGRSGLALAGAALVAFNPQFLYLSGAAGNDVAAGLAGTAVLLASVRLQKRGISPGRAAALGALFGLALMVKSNLAALLAIIELALLAAAVRDRRDWRGFLRANVIVFAVAAAIAGWWFVRNQLLYGEPTGFERVTELWGVRDPRTSWRLAISELPYLWTSLWGRFGYGQVPMPDWAYRLLAWLAAAGAAGCVMRAARRQRPSATREDRPLARAAPLLLVASVGLFFVVVFAYMLVSPAGPMGRFFFPGLSAFALLMAAGLIHWLPRRWEGVLAAVVTAGIAILAAWALVGVLRPAFARPAQLSARQLDAIPNRLDLQLGDLARLRGYEVAPTTVRPGGTVDVTVYWEALRPAGENYVVFVHLLDDDEIVVAQRDTYPGLGNYPTSAWVAGAAFADTYRITVPESAYTPNQARVQVGLYLQGGGRLTVADGRDAVQLAVVQIEPRLPQGQYPNQLWANLDNQAALVGYSLDRRVARPGETLSVMLYWQPLREMEVNYTVAVQVLTLPDRAVGKGGSWPAGGAAPTVHWRPGEVVEDLQTVTIDADAPSGIYDLTVALVGPDGLVPVVAEDGHWLDQRIYLGRVRVED